MGLVIYVSLLKCFKELTCRTTLIVLLVTAGSYSQNAAKISIRSLEGIISYRTVSPSRQK